MANRRSVSVKLQAEISGYMANLRTASAATKQFGSGILESATRNRAEFELMGRGLRNVGIAALGGLGLATKAAIDWESAWAGVEKTVDGTAQQMDMLEGELRDMAKSLPATHGEIAAVAEAAGQLGIEADNVADFTKVMIDLGETTNLTAEQAATGMARFSNIMGTAQTDVDRLGSVLVDLGNNAATTEAEILELGTRLAAAGRIAGLSEADVLAFASTLSSVGVEAEAGGTALSKVFTSIRDAVLTGGDDLETFAKVAGSTAEEFATSFREEPALAIASFVEGLGRMNDAGLSTTEIFEDLSLTDQRLMRALLSTASAGDLLVQQLDRGNKAWLENTALTDEAQKRYQTAAAQISMAWNSIKDAAIEVGSVVLPIIGDLAGVIGNLADAFGDLPGPVHEALAGVLGIGGALAVAGGAMLLLLPRIAATRTAMATLGLSFAGLAKKGLLIGGVVAAIGLLDAAIQGVMSEAPAQLDALGVGLERWAAGAELGGEAARILGDDFGRLEEAIGIAADTGVSRGLAQMIEMVPVLGTALSETDSSVKQSVQRLGELDSVLAQMVSSGNAEQAAAVWERITDLADEQGVSIERLKELFPEYAAAQETAAAETDKAAGGMDKYADAAARATQKLDEHIAAQRAAVDPVFALRKALQQVEEAQSAYTEAVEEYGEKSPEAEDAAWALAEAVAAAEQAAIDGDLSFDDFKAALKRWVDQNVITQEQADALTEAVNDTREAAEDYEGTYTADLKAWADRASIHAANVAIDRAARTRTAIINVLPTMRNAQPLTLNSVSGLLGNNAAGGPIHGPGTGTSDSIVTRVSAGEHIWTAAETQAAGGHSGVEWLRQQALSGNLVKGFAHGGAVGPVQSGPSFRGGVHADAVNVNVTAADDRFNYRQVMDELALRGVA